MDTCTARGPGRESNEAHAAHEFTDWSGRTQPCAGIQHAPTSEPLEAAPRLLRVEIQPTTYDDTDVAMFEALGRKVPTGHFEVRAVFDVPLQRNASHWIVVTSRKIADRYAAAIEAGVVFHDFKACTDIFGNPYLSMSGRCSGKYMNADLKALGF